jgi:outer membrane lipoprotein-sorting protein
MKNVILLLALIAVALFVWKPQFATTANEKASEGLLSIEDMLASESVTPPAEATPAPAEPATTQP